MCFNKEGVYKVTNTSSTDDVSIGMYIHGPRVFLGDIMSRDADPRSLDAKQRALASRALTTRFDGDPVAIGYASSYEVLRQNLCKRPK